MRILGIDPAIRKTGYGVLEGERIDSMRALDYGTFELSSRESQSTCLLAIKNFITSLIQRWKPDEAAIERIIYVQSHQTAIIMGSARAMGILAAAEANVKIAEYSPRTVKQAVSGRGAARKEQVAFMVRALLHLRETPAPDAADALAIAMTHLMSADPLKRAVIGDRKYI